MIEHGFQDHDALDLHDFGGEVKACGVCGENVFSSDVALCDECISKGCTEDHIDYADDGPEDWDGDGRPREWFDYDDDGR